MTISEALTVAVQVPGIDSNTIEKACIDAGLDSAGTYSASQSNDVDKATVNVLKSLLVSSESEGGYSYNISADTLNRRIDQLERELGIESDSRPTVKAVNLW